MKRVRTSRTSNAAFWRHPIALWVLTLPIGWATGLSLIFGGALTAFGLRKVKPATGADYSIIIYLLCLTLSIAVAAFLTGSSDFSLDRTIAAFYNILVIICLYVAYGLSRRLVIQQLRVPKSSCWPRLSQASTTLFLSSFVYILVCWIVGLRGLKELSLPSFVLGHLGSLPGILSLYAKLEILAIDYTESSLPRPFGFGIYHTEGALIAAIAGVIAAHTALRPSRRLLLHGLTAFTLYMTASRTITMFWILGMIGSAATTKNRNLSSLIKASILPLLAIMTVVVFETGIIESIFEESVSYRAGSSATRLRSYGLAIHMVMDENPITGLGVKPRDSNVIGIPIGSHSTFISSFTKGGIVGLFAFCAFYVINVFTLLKSVLIRIPATTPQVIVGMRRAGMHASAITLGWMITEDMDAAISGSLLAFIALGILAGSIQPRHRGLNRSPTNAEKNAHNVA